jgi:CubicO group peptidase (beta-lactamase class C family)
VFNNYKLEWARGYQEMEAGGNTPVTTHTLFQTASVSNPINAMAALSLSEQGKLSQKS